MASPFWGGNFSAAAIQRVRLNTEIRRNQHYRRSAVFTNMCCNIRDLCYELKLFKATKPNVVFSGHHSGYSAVMRLCLCRCHPKDVTETGAVSVMLIRLIAWGDVTSWTSVPPHRVCPWGYVIRLNSIGREVRKLERIAKKKSWPDSGSVLAISWSIWRKRQRNPIGIAGVFWAIRSEQISDRIVELYS
jgi:hypothetical protein